MRATIEALGMVQAHIVIIYTDSKIVFDGSKQETHKSNQSMWQEIREQQEAAASRGCQVICKEVKCHNTEAMLRG